MGLGNHSRGVGFYCEGNAGPLQSGLYTVSQWLSLLVGSTPPPNMGDIWGTLGHRDETSVQTPVLILYLKGNGF